MAILPLVVVGVALYDGAGRVLLARRRTGGWEFPGGKLEPGETEPAAAVRECREELGVEIEITDQIPGEQPCGDHAVLRVYAGRVLAGTPHAHEHAELRWATAADLATLDLLPADRPFVPDVVNRL